MTGYLIDFKEQVYQIPTLLSWEVCHGLGTPCDAFTVCFPYDRTMRTTLSDAVRFRGTHGDETVFYGVVDDYTISITPDEKVVTVTGRGMAAVLLDNESEAMQYDYCSLRTILDRHVRPYGVSVGITQPIREISGYTVPSGSSQWSAVAGFTQYAAGILPYFTKEGQLTITQDTGNAFILHENSGFLRLSYREKRYGVISSVLVKNNDGYRSLTVRNEPFLARGGNCRRVITAIKETSTTRMQQMGRLQITESAAEQAVCTLWIPEIFHIWPNDTVRFSDKSFGFPEQFLVSETICWCDQQGCGTEIKLIAR